MVIITRKSFKYRIYPTRAQISNLENQFSMCRYLYNWSLAERINCYQKSGKTVSYFTQKKSLPTLKKERPWFKSVHSQVLQDVINRLDKAYQSFFRRVKAGETPGFPKFKKRGRWNSIIYPQYKELPSSEIVVPKIGNVKLVCHRKMPEGAKVKTLIITKEACKWFACFSVELSLNIEPKQELPPVGIDLGLIDFYYASDGSQIPVPKNLRKKQKQLKRLYRRFSKAKKHSPKWYNLLYAIQKCHYRVKCQRNDFLHKESNKLVIKSDLVIHEDLKINNMIRKPKPKQDEETGQYLPNGASAKAGLNKSIADAGWGRFLELIRYKAAKLGKHVLAVPPHYTSQKCSACGEIVKKSLSIRTHHCTCGFVANRDHNAALNILRIGLDTPAAKAA
jgi:putative transposase